MVRPNILNLVCSGGGGHINLHHFLKNVNLRVQPENVFKIPNLTSKYSYSSAFCEPKIFLEFVRIPKNGAKIA